MALRVAADLRFEVGREDGTTVHGLVRGAGNRLRVEVDRPGAFAGRADAPAIRSLAETLAGTGVVVEVHSEGRHLVSLGAVRAPWWQRRATGSRRIRMGSLRGAWTAARARAGGSGAAVLPSSELSPPLPLWPLAPTFQRRPRRPPGTTHDAAHGGGPRLVLFRADVRAGDRQPLYWLGEETVIGSDPGCDVVLAGLAPHHAVVRHDEDDEYVVDELEGLTRVHGERLLGPLALRTGSRVTLGEHVLVYSRAEHADHGRPYAGRIGGELGRQETQAPRSTSGTAPEPDARRDPEPDPRRARAEPPPA